MTPKGYSATQIALHWIVAILILSQYLLAEGMEEAWEVVEDGGQAVTTTGALIHILIGAAVFLFALWRLSLRFSRGAPGPAEGETGLQALIAKGTHLLLYLMMLGLPVGGAAAWFLGIEVAAELHIVGKTVLMLLIFLHILGALYNQLFLKNRLIGRMMKAAD